MIHKSEASTIRAVVTREIINDVKETQRPMNIQNTPTSQSYHDPTRKDNRRVTAAEDASTAQDGRKEKQTEHA